MKTLITGYGRSGTTYTSLLLKANGIDMPHETLGKDGTVSWLHISQGVWINKKVISKTEFELIIHQMRHPLKVISSGMTIHPKSIVYMEQGLGIHSDRKDKLFRIMNTYVGWHDLIKRKRDYVFRIEDIEKEFPKILQLMKCMKVKPVFNISKTTNSRNYQMLTWKDLKNCDKKLFNQIINIKNEYKY